MPRNLDHQVVAGFGDEWSRFDQSQLSGSEIARMFDAYFSVFPWESLPTNSVGFDLGCGSGRWARLVAQRCGVLHCIDASKKALEVAERNLKDVTNCRFHLASVSEIPLDDNSADFGYSLGVLHHVPDTEEGIRCCVRKLKVGAPFLLYLYYAFDNRPFWFRAIWKVSDAVRRSVSRLPFRMRYVVSQVFAAFIYWPIARLARLLEHGKLLPERFPLSAYRDKSFYVMRTDALDRFGTRLEKRFTRQEIRDMMIAAGLEQIRFSESEPFWCAVGVKK